MYSINTFNKISETGLDLLTKAKFHLNSSEQPQALLLRSHPLKTEEVASSVLAVARAGAGTNNIPVTSLSERGIPVFNTPGANANAVKELVIASMLIASRSLFAAREFVQSLSADTENWHQTLESQKKQFKGTELPGRTLGVIGLGAIGVKVANAAEALGMNVLGYDPTITVQRAWELSASVKQTESLEQLLSQSEFVSIHVPLLPETKYLLNKDRLNLLPDNAILLNFARAEVVDEQAIVPLLEQGKLRAFANDFPNQHLHKHPKVLSLPHLGASTAEAEDLCAEMAANQLIAFLNRGEIANSVNFPAVKLAWSEGHRIAIANANVPNMVAQISSLLAEDKLNILDLLNKSRDNLAYSLIDVDGLVTEKTLTRVKAIQGVLSARVITESE